MPCQAWPGTNLEYRPGVSRKGALVDYTHKADLKIENARSYFSNRLASRQQTIAAGIAFLIYDKKRTAYTGSANTLQ